MSAQAAGASDSSNGIPLRDRCDQVIFPTPAVPYRCSLIIAEAQQLMFTICAIITNPLS